jgi:hypothetical protein
LLAEFAAGRIDPDLAWFWTREWLDQEREADADLAAGRVTRYDSDDDFLAALDERTKPVDADTEIAAVEQLIGAEALSWPDVKRLMTVPGVNVIVAATFMAAIGDIRRFPDRRKLTAYLGLAPRLQQRAPRARRGVLDDGPPARTARRLLPAHPLQARSLDRHRRRGPQARVPVVVAAQPRRGLRLRAALADQEEDAPPRAHRRRPRWQGGRDIWSTNDAMRPGRTRPRAPSPARLRTHGPRLEGQQGGCGRDTGARIRSAV